MAEGLGRPNRGELASDLVRKYACLPGARDEAKLQAKADAYSQGAYTLDATFGKLVGKGYEYIGRLDLGTSVSTLVFVEMRETGFQSWAVTFYRPGKEWRIVDIPMGTSAIPTWEKFGVGVPDMRDPAVIRVSAKAGPGAGEPEVLAASDVVAAPQWPSYPLENEEACRVASARLMSEIATGRGVDATHFMLRWYGNPLLPEQSVDQLKVKLKDGVRFVAWGAGKVVDNRIEYLGSAQLGKSHCRFTYMIKREYAPSFWTITYYKSRDRWNWSQSQSGRGHRALVEKSFGLLIPAADPTSKSVPAMATRNRR